MREKPDYLSEREFKCLELYLQYGSKARAGKEAGYSEKTACTQATRLINGKKGKRYLSDRQQKMDNEKIASSNEILEYLTKVMRGDINDITFTGEERPCGIQERTRAATELAKRLCDSNDYGKVNVTILNDIPRPKKEGRENKNE